MLKKLVQAQTCGLNREIQILNLDGQLKVTSRQISEDFSKNHRDVLESIDQLVKGVAEKSADLFIPSEYQHEQNKQWYREYFLTRDGFTLLAMGFTGPKALEWKLKYIEAFNKMEQQLKEQKPTCIEDVLISSLKEMKEVKYKLQEVEIKQIETKEEIQGIRDIVALNPNQWKEDTSSLINKIANKLGGFEHISPIRREVYKLLDNTYGVKLETRLLNKKKKMALEGTPKYKIDKINPLDVIADDKKLINGYVNIVAKLAIKYGI